MAEALARMKAEGLLPENAGDIRWLNGVEVYPYPPDVGSVFEVCGMNLGTAGTKDFGTDVEHPQFAPITTYLSESCKSYKVWNDAEFRARAVVSYAAVESSIVARSLMTGDGAEMNPHLADGDAGNSVFPNGDAVTNPLNGLALLEKEIGLTGRLGLIHCSPQFASALRERFAVDNRGGVIRTINGNVIIADAGYAGGSTPHGHAAPAGTQEWIYASGPVDVRRSEVFVQPDTVAEALDRGTVGSATTGRPNTYTYRVERYYLATFDTEFQAAVLVDRCQSGCSA
jgi:hypothetical protein